MTIPTLHRQRGNTLTGFIIGLIIGLGIAVAVALTITKGATPFTDKSGKLGRPADPAPGDAADPNKPLYGNRDATRAANRAIIAKEDKPANATNTEPPPLVLAKPAPKAETKPAADADPLGKVIASLKEPADRHGLSTTPPPAAATAAATPAAAPATAVGEDRFTYYLQAGAFREMADAESARAKLALLGFEAAISDRNSDSGVLHRVRVGPYATVETMNKSRAKLLDNGVDVAIVRNQK
jgi:cell division protein FtsN